MGHGAFKLVDYVQREVGYSYTKKLSQNGHVHICYLWLSSNQCATSLFIPYTSLFFSFSSSLVDLLTHWDGEGWDGEGRAIYRATFTCLVLRINSSPSRFRVFLEESNCNILRWKPCFWNNGYVRLEIYIYIYILFSFLNLTLFIYFSKKLQFHNIEAKRVFN